MNYHTNDTTSQDANQGRSYQCNSSGGQHQGQFYLSPRLTSVQKPNGHSSNPYLFNKKYYNNFIMIVEEKTCKRKLELKTLLQRNKKQWFQAKLQSCCTCNWMELHKQYKRDTMDFKAQVRSVESN